MLFQEQAEFYGFKSHPFLKKIEDQLKFMHVDDSSLQLFGNNILLIYPKILSFSFQPYTNEMANFTLQSSDTQQETKVMLREGKQQFPPLLTGDEYLRFYDDLIKALNHLGLGALFVLDLRNARTLDETIISPMLALIRKSNFQALCFSNEDMKGTLANLPNEGCSFVFSRSDFISYLENFLKDPQTFLNLPFSGKLTLSLLEEVLKANNFYGCLNSHFLISLDLREVTGISFFCLNFLNILIPSVSHQYGVMWQVGTELANTRALYKLLFFRTLEVNSLFLRNKYIKPQDSHSYIDGFGAKIFNEHSWGTTLKGLENYLSGLGSKFPEYLGKYVSIRYDYKFRAIRAESAYFTYYNLISSIVSELLENVAQHAKGIGYLSAMVVREKLFLFVGDCGVPPPIKNGPTLAIEMDPPRSCMFLSLGGDKTGLETLLC